MGWDWNNLKRQYPAAARVGSNRVGYATLLGDFIISLFRWAFFLIGICMAIAGIGFLLGLGALSAYHMLVNMFGVVL